MQNYGAIAAEKNSNKVAVIVKRRRLA